MRKYMKIWGMAFALTALMLTGCSQEKPEQEQEPKTEASEDSNTQNTQEPEEVSNPSFTAESIRKVEVSQGGESLYSLEYVPDENKESYERWRMQAPYEDTVLVNTEEMLKLYEALAGLTFAEAQEAPQDSGIEDSDTEIGLEFCQIEEGSEENSRAPYADSRCTLVVGKDDGAGHYYTALQSDPERIFLMDQLAVDQVLYTEPFSLILKVGAVVPVTTVEEVAITADGKNHTMTFTGDTYAWNGEEVTQEEYQQLYQQLLGILLEKELPEGAQEGSGDSLLKLEFKRNTDNLENVAVEYLDHDEDYCVLRVNDVEKFLVSREEVENLITTLNR